MKMIWCGWKSKENCHVLVNLFHGNIHSKTLCCSKIKSVFRDVKWCFNASWGLKGLIYLASRMTLILYWRLFKPYNVTFVDIILVFKSSRCIKASFYIPENTPNFPTTKGFRTKISMKLVNSTLQFSLIFKPHQIIFIHYKSRIATAIRGL